MARGGEDQKWQIKSQWTFCSRLRWISRFRVRHMDWYGSGRVGFPRPKEFLLEILDRTLIGDQCKDRQSATRRPLSGPGFDWSQVITNEQFVCYIMNRRELFIWRISQSILSVDSFSEFLLARILVKTSMRKTGRILGSANVEEWRSVLTSCSSLH